MLLPCLWGDNTFQGYEGNWCEMSDARSPATAYATPSEAPNPSAPETTASRGEFLHVRADEHFPLLNVREIWARRDLLVVLAQRDFRIRYRQAAVGVAWAIVQPLAYVLLLTPVFSLTSTPAESGGSAPAWLNLYVGFVVWQLFAGIVSIASGALLQNYELVTKVYFPRVYLPLSGSMVCLIDFCCSLPIMFAGVGISCDPSWRMLCFPVFVAWMLAIACGIGLGLSALNALYRDMSSVLPFLIQVLFFSSGIFYNVDSLSVLVKRLLALNPVFTVTMGCRWSLLDTGAPDGLMVLTSLLVTILACLAGSMYFARVERRLTDYL